MLAFHTRGLIHGKQNTTQQKRTIRPWNLAFICLWMDSWPNIILFVVNKTACESRRFTNQDFSVLSLSFLCIFYWTLRKGSWKQNHWRTTIRQWNLHCDEIGTGTCIRSSISCAQTVHEQNKTARHHNYTNVCVCVCVCVHEHCNLNAL